MKATEIKKMIVNARAYYPGQRNLQHQWVRKTVLLKSSGRHALLTGGFDRTRLS